MAVYLQFLNFVLSPYVAQVLTESFWNGSSRPYYYRYHFCFHIPQAMNFYYEVFYILDSSQLLSSSHLFIIIIIIIIII
jgi:hypothetical protein